MWLTSWQESELGIGVCVSLSLGGAAAKVWALGERRSLFSRAAVASSGGGERRLSKTRAHPHLLPLPSQQRRPRTPSQNIIARRHTLVGIVTLFELHNHKTRHQTENKNSSNRIVLNGCLRLAPKGGAPGKLSMFDMWLSHVLRVTNGWGPQGDNRSLLPPLKKERLSVGTHANPIIPPKKQHVPRQVSTTDQWLMRPTECMGGAAQVSFFFVAAVGQRRRSTALRSLPSRCRQRRQHPPPQNQKQITGLPLRRHAAGRLPLPRPGARRAARRRRPGHHKPNNNLSARRPL